MNRKHFIRSAALSGYMQAARETGLDARAALRSVGLSPRSLRDPDLPISHDALLQLLEISAELSGYHDFGARAAIARGVPDLGPVSLLLREAETLDEALSTFISRLHLHSSGLSISLESRSDASYISFRVSASPGIGVMQGVEFCTCGFVQVVRWLIGGNWKPQRVCFSHPSKGPSHVQRSFFQCAIRYEQSSSGVLIDRQTLQQPVRTSTPFLRRQAKRYLQGSLAAEPRDFSGQVAEVIAQTLRRDRCTVENVALALGIHRRTLARRLEQEGHTYSSLLQAVRREVVEQIAADPRLSLTDAAEVAGFQNLSSFSRWFRLTFGCSATQWRHDQTTLRSATLNVRP